jgi:hypothetical protein
MLGIITVIDFLIQITFLIAFDAKKYLASVIKSVVVLYLELFQLTTPLFIIKTYLD